MATDISPETLIKDIFSISTPKQFEEIAGRVFHFQYQNNLLYRAYCDTLHTDPNKISRIDQIPFLPIHFFKTHEIKTKLFTESLLFESSGTTDSIPSRHFVKDALLYKESFQKGFEYFYGPASSYCILALLPSYLERGNSSLVYMADALIKSSTDHRGGFFLNEFEKLHHILLENESEKIPTLLLGVTYAMLDFFEAFPTPLKHTIVMETGGMKGRRKELLREEVHQILKQKTGLTVIHSEYGMTELLSQAYSKKDGLFHSPPWLKMLVRPEDDPMAVSTSGSGAVNIIDLANLYSCSFIATDDAGSVFEDGSFEITGRLDHTDMRGCSLMVSIQNK